MNSLSVTLHIAADDRAIEDIEGGEQRRRSIAFVIMRHGRAATTLERQPRLGPIECLDLALLVNRQHNGMRRRRDVEADHVVERLGEGLVVG